MKSAAQRAIDRTLRKMRASNRRAESASLNDDQIRDRMMAVIADRLGEAGTVTKQDFLRAGVPAHAIEANFKRCLARARELDPTLGKLECVA